MHNFIDAAHMLIFDRFNVAIALSGVMIAVDKFLCGNAGYHLPSPPIRSLRMQLPNGSSALLCTRLFLLIAIVSRGKWMGGGDMCRRRRLDPARWKTCFRAIASCRRNNRSLNNNGRRKCVRGAQPRITEQCGNGGRASPRRQTRPSGANNPGHDAAADTGGEDGEPAGHVVPFGPILPVR